VQLTLHERPEPGPVVPVELLQRFDLLLQRCTLGCQATDEVLVSLLGFALESIGIRLGIFGYLLCRCSRIGQSLAGFPPGTVGMRLGVSGYLLCRCSRIRPNLVSLVASTGDMFVSCSLGQNQHLKGLTLGLRIGRGMRLVQ
jgi:hypothetical protein